MVPSICGDNTGQHVYVDFAGTAPIILTVQTSGAFSFNRHWSFLATQIPCSSDSLAPAGCLQYYTGTTGTINSFNFGTTPNPNVNNLAMPGTRQIASTQYGICIRAEAMQCSIDYASTSGTSFSLTGDTTMALAADQACTTDYIVIPNPAGTLDRFCGTAFNGASATMRPFTIFYVTDANDMADVGNLGFSITYSQNTCPVV